MHSLPRTLKKTVEFFERLPSIGPKTAKRLAFYLLRIPQTELEEFATTLKTLKSSALRCKKCLNLTEETFCSICLDQNRDGSIVTVVEDVLDLLSMEAGNKYKGLYHVLHGRIDPLNYVGPDEIFIKELISRVSENDEIREIILATNPNMEGEATAMYIKQQLTNLKDKKIKITRLAYGLPIGADLEYADYMTLEKAMEGRRDF